MQVGAYVAHSEIHLKKFVQPDFAITNIANFIECVNRRTFSSVANLKADINPLYKVVVLIAQPMYDKLVKNQQLVIPRDRDQSLAECPSRYCYI